jgi:hypothetical protein
LKKKRKTRQVGITFSHSNHIPTQSTRSNITIDLFRRVSLVRRVRAIRVNPIRLASISRVRHIGSRLVASGLEPVGLGVKLLLLLNEDAARAAAGENAVFADGALDPEFLAKVAALHHHEHPPEAAAVGEDEEATLEKVRL